MAAKKYFSNIDLNKNQIKNAVLETITSDSVNSPVSGQLIFDTGSNVFKYYDGSVWQSPVSRFDAQILYKGSIAHDAAAPGTVDNGDLYVFTSAGTATNYGGGVVEIGDYVIYDSSNWTVIQGNVIQASETSKGIVQLASKAEADAGTDTNNAITPEALTSWSELYDGLGEFYRTVLRKRVYTSQTINSSGLTLTHAIGQNNPKVSVYNSSGAKIDLEVSKGDGTVVLTSNTEVSGATVVISA